MSQNTLILGNDCLASRVDVQDIKGFFSTKVEILPGTKAVIYENGCNLGEIGSGQYTLETFSDKLKFWSSKNMTVYLLSASRFGIIYGPQQLMTKENLRVDATVQINYTIQNSGLFLKNLFSASSLYSRANFESDTRSLVMSALQDVFSIFSVKEMMDATFHEYATTAMESAVQNALARYGIHFEDLQILSLKHEKYDALLQKQGDLWIVKEGQVITDKENEIQLAQRLAQITFDEKANDLDILAEQVAADKQDGKLALIQRRAGQRAAMRKAIQSDKFDRIASETEMEQFLFENEKAGLIRENEKADLKLILESQDSEKEMKRKQLLEKLDMQLAHDTEEFRRTNEYELRITALDREAEIAKRTDSEANRRWLVNLEREKAERAAMLEKLGDDSATQAAVDKITFEKQQRENRLNEVKRENEAAAAEHALALEKQRELWEDELHHKKFESKMEELSAIQKMNQAQDLFAMDLWERKQRVQKELDETTRTNEQKFELDKIRCYKEFGSNGILALLNPEQAQAFIRMQETSNKNAVDAAVGAARSEEQVKSKDDLIAMMREMMEQQAKNAALMAQMHIQTPVAPIINSTTGGVPAGAGLSGRILVCPHCKAQVDAANKYCPNCGKQL